MTFDPMNFHFGGDVNPSRFVEQSTSEDHELVQATANSMHVVGVTGEGSGAAPLPQNTSNLAGEEGETNEVRFFGSNAILELGSGGCDAGQFLRPDAAGKGVVADAGEIAFFKPFTAGLEGEKVYGWVMPPFVIPAEESSS